MTWKYVEQMKESKQKKYQRRKFRKYVEVDPTLHLQWFRFFVAVVVNNNNKNIYSFILFYKFVTLLVINFLSSKLT